MKKISLNQLISNYGNEVMIIKAITGRNIKLSNELGTVSIVVRTDKRYTTKDNGNHIVSSETLLKDFAIYTAYVFDEHGSPCKFISYDALQYNKAKDKFTLINNETWDKLNSAGLDPNEISNSFEKLENLKRILRPTAYYDFIPSPKNK